MSSEFNEFMNWLKETKKNGGPDLYKRQIYNDGYENGLNDGYENGFNDGYKNGRNDGRKDMIPLIIGGVVVAFILCKCWKPTKQKLNSHWPFRKEKVDKSKSKLIKDVEECQPENEIDSNTDEEMYDREDLKEIATVTD